MNLASTTVAIHRRTVRSICNALRHLHHRCLGIQGFRIFRTAAPSLPVPPTSCEKWGKRIVGRRLEMMDLPGGIICGSHPDS
jgi:hypothetical protein